MATMRAMPMNAANIIAAGRNTYRSAQPDDDQRRDAALRYTAIALELEGANYEDLIRHLITADEIDEDAWTWVVGRDEYKLVRYEGVEDVNGRTGDLEYVVPVNLTVREEEDAAEASVGVRWTFPGGEQRIIGYFPPNL